MNQLRNIVLLCRNIPKSSQFFQEVIGLNVIMESDSLVEFDTGTIPLIIKEGGEGESTYSTGYSPILTFDINEMDDAITKAISMGSYLDGPIRYPAHGKIASIRTFDGFMIGLFEPNKDI